MSAHPDLFIGRNVIHDAVVTLPIKSRMEGVYIVGKQGMGKSNLITTCIAQDMHAGHGLCELDPHGDLITDTLALVPPHREDDVILLDLQDTEYPFAFDIFAGIDTTNPDSLATGEERIVGIFKKVWGDIGWGARLEDLLANAAQTLLANPSTTLADVPRLLTDPAYRARLIRNVTNQEVLDYWHTEFDVLTPKGQAAIFSPLMNKVRKFLRHPLLSRIVSQSGTTVDFTQLLARRQILLVRLNSKLKEATSLLGTAIVLRLFEAALERSTIPMSERHPFFIYADEFQSFATTSFGELIEQARKYQCGTILAHQRREQLSPELQSATKGANNVICFQLQADDARELSREFSTQHSPRLPSDDLLVWALSHSDTTIKKSALQLVTTIPLVSVQSYDLAPLFTCEEKHRFFEERLRRAVRSGNTSLGAFPRQYVYGTIDLERGAYARAADAFAALRDRLLAVHQLLPELLVSLEPGTAAAKLRQPSGSRQYLLRFPLAIPDNWSGAVPKLLAADSDDIVTLPASVPPPALAAGLRARRIRERSRRRFAPPPSTPAYKQEPKPAAPEPIHRQEMPVMAEVELDE